MSIHFVRIQDTVSDLENSIEKYKEMNRDRKIFEMIKPGKDIMSEIDTAIKDIALFDSESVLLQKSIDEYTGNKKQADLGFDKKSALRIISEIEVIRPDYDALRSLNNQINEHVQNGIMIINAKEEIDELIKQLPDECPVCGAPLKADLCQE
jgi:DNA repair exonuclease SbcCD ATPase subunit